ncbi:MAG: PHP domain-containing protein, partial [Planctomycetaceae bacterium]|nr:PHP domain-containing protein [Planctomycetaceae bacterium]
MQTFCKPFLAIVIILGLSTGHARADALARLNADRLDAVHKAVIALQSQRDDSPSPGPYRDYRANLHVHSAFSHDSRGKLDDIVAAAKSAGTSVLMFTEHPADHYDFFKDGHQGTQDGVLLIPGAEMNGFLVYPTHSMRGLASGTPQELSDLVRGRGGLMFVAHLEERMDWQIAGVT